MRQNRITANLPARDFDVTVAFYGTLGFEVLYRDDGWLILTRDGLEVEFFLHRDLDPFESWHSACVRVDDLEGLQATWQALDLGKDPMGRARGLETIGGPGDVRFFALIDCDGSLLRCIDNGSV